MIRHIAQGFWRFRRDRNGAAAVEYALLLPVLLMFSFGILEVSLCMASLVTLEGGLKEASRYGITNIANGSLTNSQILNQVPDAFKQGTPPDPRTMMIGFILNQNTLDLIDLNTATITTKVYDSFSVTKDGEPFVDKPDFPHAGDPPNGVYDVGEPYADVNCNGTRDGPGSKGDGTGVAGDIVVYTVNYNWTIMTPIIGKFLGQPDPKHPGKYIIPMGASIVVKNEPSLSGSSFCS